MPRSAHGLLQRGRHLGTRTLRAARRLSKLVLVVAAFGRILREIRLLRGQGPLDVTLALLSAVGGTFLDRILI